MPVRILTRYWRQPTAPRSLAIFILMVAGMAWLRLGIFPDQLISLSYGVPLLICLFYPDRRLLWAMAGAFVALSAYKSFVALESPPDSFSPIAMAWGMQVFNTVAVTLAVHMIINLLEALQDAKSESEAFLDSLVEILDAFGPAAFPFFLRALNDEKGSATEFALVAVADYLHRFRVRTQVRGLPCRPRVPYATG